MHFAGEHTSTDSQGYLNGAVAPGRGPRSERMQRKDVIGTQTRVSVVQVRLRLRPADAEVSRGAGGLASRLDTTLCGPGGSAWTYQSLSGC
ncbi:hypothetical protein SAMN05661093_07593 [Kibdelosporangium aridum]|uniref:Uncharacterized protein n=1 Tax=Kibdelosporangium aridum TaxID=2030 RepID=A0A1W2FM46_KIBAR|nr:hypothetical protein SAMN05661093_07593 [Kibdelosporangium aridum]